MMFLLFKNFKASYLTLSIYLEEAPSPGFTYFLHPRPPLAHSQAVFRSPLPPSASGLWRTLYPCSHSQHYMIYHSFAIQLLISLSQSTHTRRHFQSAGHLTQSLTIDSSSDIPPCLVLGIPKSAVLILRLRAYYLIFFSAVSIQIVT